jgi:hypothetical protein
MSISDFHLIAVELGDEDTMLTRALAALESVEAGETAFLPEYLAWTPRGSSNAFMRLMTWARERDINIITTLNLGSELTEDLPGRPNGERLNALTVFTRHGSVHVPQAKCSTQSFEMDKSLDGPGLCVSPYDRINRVMLDIDESIVEARFLVGSDIFACHRLSPPELRCDLLVVLGNFPVGAERVVSRLLERVIEAGVARTAIHVNAFNIPAEPTQQASMIKVEEVLDSVPGTALVDEWASPRAIRSAFYVYDDEDVRDFVSMSELPRKGRITVPRSRWTAPLSTGNYPITVVL